MTFRNHWGKASIALGLPGVLGIAALAAGATGIAALDESPVAQKSLQHANTLSQAFRSASEQVLPSVVTIRVTKDIDNAASAHGPRADRFERDLPEHLQDHPFFRRFFDGIPRAPHVPHEGPRGRSGMGSGVIIDSSGIILTNNHVVRGGGRVTVRLHDGREFDAVDVGTDPKTDVAVIRIDGAGDLPAAELGNSDSVNVGDWVMAVGAPFGLNETVTAGIISAKSRGIGITAREDFLQTDAAINPGNSGGPLVNLNGEVVGINTAISSTSGGYQGIGFAIPINLARWVGDQLTLTGHVERAFLGIGIQQITDELTDHFGLSAIEGVVVTAVRPDSPAAQAGLLAGDVIVEFDGRAVGAPRELQGIVERAAINAEHAVVVIRDEKRVKLNVRVATMPENVSVGTRAADGATFEQLGLELSGLDADVAKQLGLTDVTGVVITGVRPRSPAARAGLRTSMVITQVNRQAVKSPDDFERVLQAESDSDGVLLLIRDASGSRFVVVPRG